MYLAPAALSRIDRMSLAGYSSATVMALIHRRAAHIRIELSFFRTLTIGDAYGESDASIVCDHGVPCGRSSDRPLLPTLLLAILASPVVDRQTVFFFLLASSLQLVRSSFLVGHRPTFLRLLFAYPTPSMGCLVWLLLLGGRQLRFPVVCPVPLPDCSFIVFCCFSFFRLLQLLVRFPQLCIPAGSM